MGETVCVEIIGIDIHIVFVLVDPFHALEAKEMDCCSRYVNFTLKTFIMSVLFHTRILLEHLFNETDFKNSTKVRVRKIQFYKIRFCSNFEGFQILSN